MTTTYAWPVMNWNELRRDRRDRFVAVMRQEEVDHVLVSGFDNLRFVTDYRTTLTYDSNLDWFSALVDDDGRSVLFVNDAAEDQDDPLPDYPWIKRRVAGPSWQSFWTHTDLYVRTLVRELRDAGVKRLGVEQMHFEVMNGIEAAMPELDVVPMNWPLLEMRKIKSPQEVALIEAAADVGSLCMAAAIEEAEEGMTDFDVAGIAIDRAYHHGVEWISHAVLVARGSGKKVNWFPTGRRLWSGDSFIFDFGVYGQGGYCHDFCRTHFIGDPRPETLLAHRALVAAFEEGISMAGPGVRCSKVTETINSALTAQGFPTTGYAMGHGIGLRLIELPAISFPDGMQTDDVLTEGMVICIEPSTSVEVEDAIVAVKEEDMFKVEASGLRKITKTSRANV